MSTITKYNKRGKDTKVVAPKAERRSGKLVYPNPLLWEQVGAGEYLIETNRGKSFLGMVVYDKSRHKMIVCYHAYSVWAGLDNMWHTGFPGYTFYQLAPKKLADR